MISKKRKSSSRCKRMKRQARLQSAQAWLKEHSGKDRKIARNYRKRYGVDWACAFQELELLGVRLDAQYINSVLQNLEPEKAAKRRRKEDDVEDFRVELIEQDEHHAFIAGFTPGGVPYGITWDEWAELNACKDS